MACAFFVVAVAGADLQASTAYVGLFADEAHSVTSVFNMGAITEFDVWVWWLPSEHGLHSTIFRLTYPPNVTPGTITLNPNSQPLIGCNDGYEPMCATFVSCQLGWVWTHRQRCYLTGYKPGDIKIGPPGVNTLEAWNCEPGYPAEPMIVISRLYVNWWWDEAEPQSWGAIKSLYR